MDIRIKLNPQYEQLRPYVEHLAQTGELHGEIVHRGRNSLYRLTVEGVDLVVKSFSHMTVANRFIYAHLRKIKAVRSYDNAVRIAQLGLLTPDPIASIDVIQYGNLRRGYYICRYVDAQKTTRWYERPDGKELETILATYIYGLRSMGVLHRDLNPGNILRDRQGNLFLIDLNRISFGNTSESATITNICQMDHDEEQVRALATAYATARGDSKPTDFAKKVVESRARYEHWHFYKRKIKRLLKPWKKR